MKMQTLLMMTIAIAMGLASDITVAAPSCDEAFDKETGLYFCFGQDDEGGVGFLGFEIIPPPGDGDFGVHILDTDHNCICLAKGNTNNPKFRESLEFLCNNNGVFGDAMVAKVTGNGKKIKKGQYQFESGDLLIVFECEAVDTLPFPPPPAVEGNPRWR